MNAFQKVETPLMERYLTVCSQCQWERQFFGTEQEARESAERTGWEFRRQHPYPMHTEFPFCPHCKLLVP